MGRRETIDLTGIYVVYRVSRKNYSMGLHPRVCCAVARWTSVAPDFHIEETNTYTCTITTLDHRIINTYSKYLKSRLEPLTMTKGTSNMVWLVENPKATSPDMPTHKSGAA